MRIFMLAASAAALAITTPALAERGGGQGGGKDKAAQADRGGGKDAQRGRGGDKGQAKQSDRGPGRQAQADRGPNRNAAQRDDRRAAKSVRVEDRDDRGRDKGEARVLRADKLDRNSVRLGDNDVLLRRAFDRDFFPGRGRGLIAGCPPGLDKRDNGCMPPGHVKNLLGTSFARTAFANSLLPYNYRNWYRDNDDYLFRAGDGFIYRVNRDNGLIDGLIPLLTGSSYGGYYALGDPWPAPYNFYNVPQQYQNLWSDRGDDCYRYDGWGAIYRVDCDTNVVNSIVSLLAGDLGVGSPLPMAYNVYNVPLNYRTSYYDTPDAWYRYNDGYIYRVDPTTRLITAVIDALV